MKRSLLSPLAGLLLLLATGAVQAREIKDMSGQTVTVPDQIHKVYAMTHAFPPMTALAPELLAGFASPASPSPDMLGYLPSSMAGLPNLGMGTDANLEKLKGAGIDIALGWASTSEQYPAKQLSRIGVPVVNIDVDRLELYPATLRFLGVLLHQETKAEEEAQALETIQSRLRLAFKDLPETELPRVYYAESMDGLVSQCDLSDRTEVIRLAGGANAVKCDNAKSMAGNYPIDMEKLIMLDPEVIVARYAKTAQMIRADARWSRITAVKTGRVYTVPAYPFNWFDRPPSFLRAMGAQWLANLLHPERYPFERRDETRRFFRLFFGSAPSDADIDRLYAQ